MMGKTPEERTNNLLIKTEKFEEFFQQLKEESKEEDNQIAELERQNLEINEELQKERKKNTEDKWKWDQNFKNEVQIHNEISKGFVDKIIELETQLSDFRKLNESKETKIRKLTEEAFKLKLVNQQLEAERKRESNEKHYYFLKCKKIQESLNTESLTASSVHTTTSSTSFSPSSPALPPPPPPQSSLPCLSPPSPTKKMQIAPSSSMSPAPSHFNMPDLTAKVYMHYTTHKDIIRRRMRDITRLRNMPHQNINHLKMEEFLKDLQKLSEDNKNPMTLLKVEKFYKSQVKEKLAWMKPRAKKTADAKLRQFFDLIELAAVKLKI